METFWLEREADVPEAEWNASESNLKFSQSSCYRRTYFIDGSKTTIYDGILRMINQFLD